MVVSTRGRTLIAAVVSTLVGCGGGSGDEVDTAAVPYLNAQGELTIQFTPMYSAWDGVNEYKVPAIVAQKVSGTQWSIEPPDAADLAPDANGGVMITTRRPGDFKVTAKAGNVTGSSMLHVTAATPEQWKMGETRYRNDVKISLGMPSGMPPAGMPPAAMPVGGSGGGAPMGGPPGFDLPDNASCANCHGEGATLLGIEHTPQQIGGYSDQELVTIFTTGVKPEKSTFKSMVPPPLYRILHTWNTMSPAEESQALVVYLRSLEPKAQGAIIYPRPPGAPPPP